MPYDSPQEEPGLSPDQYEQLVQFLMTWAGLTRQQAEERATGRAHPGQVTRSLKPAVRRPIYPPREAPRSRAQ